MSLTNASAASAPQTGDIPAPREVCAFNKVESATEYAKRRERENEQRAMGLQLQHLDVMRWAGVL